MKNTIRELIQSGTTPDELRAIIDKYEAEMKETAALAKEQEIEEARMVLMDALAKYYMATGLLTEEEVKVVVQYDQMIAVGFHIPGAFDKVLAIEKCWLQDDISNQIRNTIRDYAYEHGLAFYNIRNHEGLLRNLMIRTSSTGELMVLLQVRVSQDKD